jgi:hypothetical protein
MSLAKPKTTDTLIILTLVGGAIYLFLYYISHNYQLPKPLLGEEVHTTAKAFSVTAVSAGSGYQFQRIRYMYDISGKWYTGSAKLGKKSGAVSLGDDVPIVYDSWFLENSRVDEELSGNGFNEVGNYYYKSEVGYEKLVVTSSLIVVHRYSSNQVLLTMDVGLVTAQSDSFVGFNWLDVNLLEKDDYTFLNADNAKDSLKILNSSYEYLKTGAMYR